MDRQFQAFGALWRKFLVTDRKKASQWYLAFLYVNFLLNLVKGVLIVPLYLSYMEPRLYGAWLACGGVIAYLSLCEFGVNRVVVQKVAVCVASSNNSQLAAVIGTGVRLAAFLSVLPLLIGLAISPFVARIVQISGPEAIELRTAFIVASLAASLMIFSFTPRGVVQGMQRQVFVNSSYTGGLALSIMVTLILLMRGQGILAIPIGALVHSAITVSANFAYMMVVLRRQGLLERPRFDLALFKEIFSSSSFQFGGSVAHTLSAQSDNVIIAAALNPELCNVFTFTGMAPKMSATLGAYIPHAAMPALAHLAGHSEPARIKRVLADIIKYSTMVAAMLLCGALFLNEAVVDIWVGHRFYGGHWLNVIFCVGALSSLYFLGLNAILNALGEFRISGILVIFQGCAQLLFMVVLGYVLGMVGLALATVLASTLTIPLQAVKLLRRLHIPTRELVRGLYDLAGVVAVPLAAVLLVRLFWNPRDMLQLSIFCITYGVISVAGYLTIYKEVRDVAAEVLSKLSLRLHI